MASLPVSVDLSQLVQAGPIARAGIFANLSSSIEALAQTGVERWQRAVMVAPLWEGERRAYVESIRYRMVGDYAAEVSSNYKYVEDIESGRPPRDLKKMLNTSLKVRTSKKGVRYLIIPFRHNTPGHTAHAPAMPTSVYDAAKRLAPSKVRGHGQRQSGTGAWDTQTKSPAMVRQRLYSWGDRLGAGMAPKLKPAHKSDPYAGMVRFKEAKGGSTYLTFRVMTENSTGWIVQAKPGLFIARAVADSLQRSAAADLPAAIQRDLNAV